MNILIMNILNTNIEHSNHEHSEHEHSEHEHPGNILGHTGQKFSIQWVFGSKHIQASGKKTSDYFNTLVYSSRPNMNLKRPFSTCILYVWEVLTHFHSFLKKNESRLLGLLGTRCLFECYAWRSYRLLTNILPGRTRDLPGCTRHRGAGYSVGLKETQASLYIL